MSSTARLSSCKLKPVGSFMKSVYLIFDLPLLLPSIFPSIIFSSRVSSHLILSFQYFCLQKWFRNDSSTSFFLESSAFCASTMSPTDSKRCGAKRRKNKKGTCLVQSNLDSFEVKLAETASSVATPSTSSPSTSSVGISFQAIATVSSPSTRNGLLAATATAVPRVSSERMGKTEVPKKRCGGTINSRQTCKRSRIDTSDGEAASQTEPIDLEENTCEEVVDLTCESSEPVVVDLTCNDSVVIVEENACHQQSQELRSQQPPESCVLSSDDDESRDNDVVLTSTLPRDLELLEDRISSTRRSGTVSCPICMDGYSEIVQSGRLIVSTKCGHVFCSQCLRDSLRNANSCPTCRKKLGYKQYHPIYI